MSVSKTAKTGSDPYLCTAVGFVTVAMLVGVWAGVDTSNRRENIAKKRAEMAKNWDGATPLMCRVKEKGGRRFERVTVDGLTPEEIEAKRANIAKPTCNVVKTDAKPAQG